MLIVRDYQGSGYTSVGEARRFVHIASPLNSDDRGVRRDSVDRESKQIVHKDIPWLRPHSNQRLGADAVSTVTVARPITIIYSWFFVSLSRINRPLRDNGNSQASWSPRNTLGPEDLATFLEVENATSPIVADADNAGLVSGDKLDSADTSHGRLVQFWHCVDQRRFSRGDGNGQSPATFGHQRRPLERRHLQPIQCQRAVQETNHKEHRARYIALWVCLKGGTLHGLERGIRQETLGDLSGDSEVVYEYCGRLG